MVKFELSNLRGIKQIIFKIQDHIQHSAPNPPSSLGSPTSPEAFIGTRRTPYSSTAQAFDTTCCSGLLKAITTHLQESKLEGACIDVCSPENSTINTAIIATLPAHNYLPSTVHGHSDQTLAPRPAILSLEM